MITLAYLTTIALAGILTAFVAGNNLSAAVGTIIGSRITSRAIGIAIGILGFTLGLMLEGSALHTASANLLPHSYTLVSYAFLVSFALFILAYFLRSPLSLTMVLVGVAIGLSIHHGYTVNGNFVILMVITWILAPLGSVLFAFLLNRELQKRQSRNFWSEISYLKVILIAVSFLTAFTLGANTLGLIANMAGFDIWVIASMITGIVTGSLFLSKGIIKRVGEEMYLMRYSNALTSLLVSSVFVEIATLFSIPLSNTQTLTSSVLGTGMSYRTKAIYMRPFMIVLATWIIAPIAGLFLGLVI
ncbi:MAG: inorganic phosphate transporter [Candidatus Thermoplasmatota archaeon]|jgi:PiT family inorganic phosphate transporter|nr:inorganic phosphate transporter [Candidatus Thermoplasmatota archaeon]